MARTARGRRYHAEARIAVLLLGALVLAGLAPAGASTRSTRLDAVLAPVRYPLVAPRAIALSAPIAGAAATVSDPIHGPYSMTSDACASCHRGHTGSAVNLLPHRGSQSGLCLSCHDGTGGPNVGAVFTDPAIPANNPADRSYYGHDVLAASSHTSSISNEFGGVLNRHSECGDCHNPHRAGGPAATASAAGWTSSGSLAGISGVSVVNGAAGTAPAYTFLDGVTTPITLEYQLCFKCHSGFTVLPSNVGFTPSRYELDKGIEFNPANPSYHPIEAAGKNQTAAMAASLAGPSPYKRWTFTTTSTIRCVNCHANDGSSGPDLAAHRSPNRGILTANYRDRVLKASGEPYAAADFALCYLCHTEAPFAANGESSTATNFRFHNKHVFDIGGDGTTSTDIDTPGAGRGRAICAECHYRIHSAIYSVGGQTITGGRLVNFAPNVTANNGVLSWVQGATSGGTCTLICHGQAHDAYQY